jgi:hypothetical protein
MPLATQAEYARHRQISREAVRKRTTTAGSPIPVHGPKRLIDVDEADALWEVTKTAPADYRTYHEARTAKMVVDAKRAATRTSSPGVSEPNRHPESGTNRLSFPDAWRSRVATRVRITSG